MSHCSNGDVLVSSLAHTYALAMSIAAIQSCSHAAMQSCSHFSHAAFRATAAMEMSQYIMFMSIAMLIAAIQPFSHAVIQSYSQFMLGEFSASAASAATTAMEIAQSYPCSYLCHAHCSHSVMRLCSHAALESSQSPQSPQSLQI